MSDLDLVKKQGVKDLTGDLAVGSGVYKALNDAVRETLDKAVERAEQNQRRTVKARDV